jgi:hypothetical protein
MCFMIMPYGFKPSQKPDGTAAPDQIDFNRISAFEPAIHQLGYNPREPTKDLGAAIIKEMIEHWPFPTSSSQTSRRQTATFTKRRWGPLSWSPNQLRTPSPTARLASVLYQAGRAREAIDQARVCFGSGLQAQDRYYRGLAYYIAGRRDIAD